MSSRRVNVNVGNGLIETRSQKRWNGVPRRSVGKPRQSSSPFIETLAPTMKLSMKCWLTRTSITRSCGMPSTPGMKAFLSYAARRW